MSIKKCLFLFSILFCFSVITVFAEDKPVITDYQWTFIPCHDKKNDLRIAIRMYYRGAIPYFLVVNPYQFTTETSPATNYMPRKTKGPRGFTMDELQKTPYIKALSKYTSLPDKLENYGIIGANHPVQGAFLTVDMCPSSKPFEEAFFKTLVTKANSLNHAVPIGISISGLWIIQHPQEFNWLIDQGKTNKFQITWINHSFSHLYFPDLDLQHNFMLAPQTNIDHEILAAEKLLLENNQLPSVFFRFPGLISNQKLIAKLHAFGLIPIGSNAWLAKN